MNEANQTDIGGQFEHRFGSMEAAMRDFLESDRQWKSQITEYIRKVDDKASQAGRADLGTLAVWAGVVLTIIALVASPIGIFLMREMDRHDNAIANLDTKLQREFALTAEGIKQSVAEADVKSREQRDDSNRRIVRLENLHDDFQKEEMNELRDRRRNQVPNYPAQKPVRRMTALEYLNSP